MGTVRINEFYIIFQFSLQARFLLCYKILVRIEICQQIGGTDSFYFILDEYKVKIFIKIVINLCIFVMISVIAENVVGNWINW
jgi:hypothetical protein